MYTQNFFASVREHYKYSRRESWELLITIALVALMFAFDDGRETFSLAHWGFNYFNTFLIVTLVFLIHTTAQKLWGIAVGYRVRYKMWSYGLALGVAATILSQGQIIIPLPGGASFAVIPKHRLGGFRFGLKYNLVGWISGLGPLANILTAMFAKFMFYQVLGITNPLVDKLIFISFLVAFFMLLPIPPLPGLSLFFGSRLLYVIVFGFILTYVILFVLQIYSFIIAVIIAFIIWVSYYFIFEHGWE